MNWRRRLLTAVAILALLTLLGFADLVRMGLLLRELKEGGRLLQASTITLGSSPSNWDDGTIAAAERQQRDGSRMVSSAARDLLADPLLSAAERILVLHDQIAAILDLARAAQAVSGASADSITVARAYQTAKAGGGSQQAILLRFLTASQVPLDDAHRRLGPAEAALQTDLSKPVLASIRTSILSVLGPLDRASSQVSAGQAAAQFLPAAIGASGPRTYLILLANPSELRPSGGFYGAVGYVTMTGGTPSGLEIRGSTTYEQGIKQVFPVPSALGRYLIFDRNSLQIGDSGWDPDFPTTAKLTESMMNAATGRNVDGTIAFDPYAVQALLAITGPVDVPGYGRFTQDDFFQRLNVIVNVNPNGNPAAIGSIAQVVVSRILNQPADAWPQMWTAIASEARGRHAMMFSHDPNLQAELASAHFDGALVIPGPEDDYLAVVDANVGGTKGDAYVHKKIDVKVERYSTGIARHEVTVRYDMPLPTDAIDRALNPHSGGAYRDYVRFYLPESATVKALNIFVDDKPTDANSLESIGIAHQKRVAATFLNIPRGHSMEIHLFYEVPLNPAASYSLLIQKQAGSPAVPTTLEVSLPGAGIHRPSVDLRQDAQVRLTW